MRAVRLGLGSLATLVLVAGVALASPGVAAGSDGFVEKATTTYVVNPDKERLDVTIDLTFKNTSPSTSSGYFYYDGDYVWLEREATNVRATSPGASVSVSRVKRSGGFDEYHVRWSPVLLYGKTRSVHITYQIPTGAPRSRSWFRISPAYVDFCVIGSGLDGGSTTIRVPLGYATSIDSQENGELDSSIDGDTRTYTTGTLADAYRFWACLSGEQPARYASTRTSAPSGREIDIQAWPDDPVWAADIETQLDVVLTRLEDLTGQALPGDGPLAVREVGQGTLGQYAGFFEPETGIARIGEDLEAKGLITHELSHAWFNGDLFRARWLSEGYAEWARTSIDGETCSAPTYPGTGSPNLEAWQFAGPRATDEELAVVDYQYAAACALVREVAARIGEEGMRRVLAALIDHDLAYRDGASALKGASAAAGWQTWLDMVDEVGLAGDPAADAGAADAASVADLLVPYGITRSAGSAVLADRATARQAYHALQALFGAWDVPPVILRAMAGWHFDSATPAMATATRVFDESAAVADVLSGVSGSTGKARDLVEAATTQAELDAALAAADDRLAAAREVAAARDALAAPRDPVTDIGMLGTDLAPALDAAIRAIQDDDTAAARSGAQAVQAALADAPGQGRLRLLVGVGVPVLVLLALLAAVLLRRRRRAALAAASTISSGPAPDAGGEPGLPERAEAPESPEPIEPQAGIEPIGPQASIEPPASHEPPEGAEPPAN